MVVPPGEHTLSFSIAGCSPVVKTISAAPLTVIAANSTIADAYATYLMVIGFEEAKNFLEKNTHFDAILVYGDQDKMKVYSTKGVKLAE